MKKSLFVLAAVIAAGFVSSARAAWTVLSLPDATSGSTTSMGHLPDGRFIYGHHGSLARQNTFGSSAASPYANAPGGSSDYSFVTSSHVGIYGAGTFSYGSALTSTDFTVRDTSITSPYAGASYGGNLIMTGAAGGASGIYHISSSGLFTTLASSFSPWSGGVAINPLATGSDAFLYVAFAGPGPLNNFIYSFTADEVGAAIGDPLNSPLAFGSATQVGYLPDASSLAYDPAQNRLYGAGFNDPGFLHTLDLDTNETGKLALPGGAVNTMAATFSDGVKFYVGWLSRDDWGSGAKVNYGYAPASTLPIPEPGAALLLLLAVAANAARRNRASHR